MARKKKRKLKIKNIILAIFIIILLCGGLIFYIKYFDKESNNNHEEDNKIENKKEEKKEYSLSLVMVGDALIHSSVYRDANRLANYQGYDFKPQIKYIKEYVSNYDLAYYNQETILGGQSIGLSDYPQFNSPFEVGDAMLDAGFNLVSLATNHTVDRGSQAVLNSREYWNNKTKEYVDAGNILHAVGSYSSSEEKEQLETKILKTNNITYAMLNYTYGTNGMPVSNDYLVNVWPTDIDNIGNPEYDTKYQKYKEVVKEDISKIRDSVDVLIVAMHWGIEYTHTPTNYEKDIASFLAENDVDIVIGTHPHVIQPVEFIGNTLVFYSLGNFISAQYQNQGTCTYYKCMVGLMSSLNITKTIENEETTIKIDNVKNNLIYTYYTNWSNFLVIPFSNPEIKNYLNNYQTVYDTYSKVISSSDERITTVPLSS